MRRLGRLLVDHRQPALGAAMDILVRHGGTAILSETPKSTASSTRSRAAREPRSR